MTLALPEGFALTVAAACGLSAGALLLRPRQVNRSPREPLDGEGSADQRFQELFTSLTVGAIIVDGRGFITAVNPAASVIFEFGAKSFVGRAVIEAIPSFELDRRVREALAGNPSRGIVELKGVPHSRRLVVTALPFDSQAGALIVASDETKLHDLEESRSDFITNLSHELRTPLSSVKLMIETLADNDGDAEVRRMFLPRVQDEVDRMVRLVEDLLQLARADSGWMRLRRQQSDLASLTQAILEPFEARAAQNGVRLTFEGTPAIIESDPERIAQVVVNLVDNALRHTPAGGRVTVSVRTDGSEGALTVADTGEGIPFRDLPNVFDRFYVVDRSRARAAGGTGLGLSIVKQIVEAHGGRVSAESELGLGAVFICRLPLSSQPAMTELQR